MKNVENIPNKSGDITSQEAIINGDEKDKSTSIIHSSGSDIDSRRNKSLDERIQEFPAHHRENFKKLAEGGQFDELFECGEMNTVKIFDVEAGCSECVWAELF